MIPMLASMGCPYNCDFCMDWNNPYRALSSERLLEDLRYAFENLTSGKLFFYDPNFGIRFDETLTLFETTPAGRRTPYLTVILKNYDAPVYFRKMVEVYSVLLSSQMLRQRLAAMTSRWVKFVNSFRTYSFGSLLAILKETLRRLATEADYRADHAGDSQRLPDIYAREYKQRLGKYAELMPVAESQPALDDEAGQLAGHRTQGRAVQGQAAAVSDIVLIQ